MTHGMLSAIALISLVMGSGVAQGEASRSDDARQSNPLGASGITVTPRSSWEGWLHHGPRDFTPEPHVPPRSPDLGTPTAPLTPSIGPGSESLGPEAGSSPSRLRSNAERERNGMRNGQPEPYRGF